MKFLFGVSEVFLSQRFEEEIEKVDCNLKSVYKIRYRKFFEYIFILQISCLFVSTIVLYIWSRIGINAGVVVSTGWLVMIFVIVIYPPIEHLMRIIKEGFADVRIGDTSLIVYYILTRRYRRIMVGEIKNVRIIIIHHEIYLTRMLPKCLTFIIEGVDTQVRLYVDLRDKMMQKDFFAFLNCIKKKGINIEVKVNYFKRIEIEEQ